MDAVKHAALVQEIANMREYAERLPDGEEKDKMLAAMADAQGEVKSYAEKIAAGDTDPDDDGDDDTEGDGDDDEDGATDPELESIIEQMRSEGYDVADDGDEDSPDAATDTASANNPNAGTSAAPAPMKGAKTYAEQRLERLMIDSIDHDVNALVSEGKITPAQASVAKRVCYTLSGTEPEGQALKAYSEDERDSGVQELIAMLKGNADLGMLRTYTKDDHQGTEMKRQVLTDTPVVNGQKVNEDSMDEAAKIKQYAEKHGITDFGKAAVAYEKANPSEIKRYGQGE
jgi:hypothetical protein